MTETLLSTRVVGVAGGHPVREESTAGTGGAGPGPGTFCPACGQVLSSDAPGSPSGAPRDGCPGCGTELCGPADDRHSRIGLTFAHRAGLRTRTGVVLDERGGQVTMLGDGGITEVDTDRLRPEDDGDLLAHLVSPAYRLRVVAGQDPGGRARLLERVAELLGSTAARRAYALCALQRGDVDGLGDAGLSATEATWLRLWHHHRQGDPAGVLAALADLPPGGYPDKLAVIATGFGALTGLADGRQLVAAHVRGRAGDPLAQVLLLAAGDDPDWRPGPAGAAAEGSPGVRFTSATAAGRYRCVLAAAASPSDLAAAEEAGGHDDSAALRFALLSGRWPADATRVRPATVLAAGEGAVDDLIDAGLAGREVLDEAVDQQHTSAPYLRSRLAAGELSGAELAGHPFEGARRAFLTGRAPNADDPAVRLLTLLHRLRAGDPGVVAELDALLPGQHRVVARAVGRSLATGVVDPAALADTSTWEVLGPLATTSGAAPPEVRRLAAWWSLRRATRHLFAWEWDAAATVAGDLLADLANDPDLAGLAAEAANVAACARWQAGDARGAALLLAGTHRGEAGSAPVPPAVLINLSLVAATAGDRHGVAEALARLVFDVDDLLVRVEAARRAVSAWYGGTGDQLAAPQAGSPPPAMTGALRTLAISTSRAHLVDHGLAEVFTELMACLHGRPPAPGETPPLPVVPASPWLILGLPFGTGTAEARAAFIRRARMLRSQPETAPFKLSDLTWALHEIEGQDEDPWRLLDHYRVPLVPVAEPPGLFRPAPRPAARRSPRPAAGDLDGLAWAAVRRAARDLVASAIRTDHSDPYPCPSQPFPGGHPAGEGADQKGQVP